MNYIPKLKKPDSEILITVYRGKYNPLGRKHAADLIEIRVSNHAQKYILLKIRLWLCSIPFHRTFDINIPSSMVPASKGVA